MPATADLLTHVFHLAAFTAANLIFVWAVAKRLKMVSKAQPVEPLAPWPTRIRSFLLHVVFQHKLFKHPLRGTMHAFIFYGFISYLVHTTSQMIAGNGWSLFKMYGVNPYTFYLTDHIQMFSFSMATTGIIVVSLIASIGLTFWLMHSIRLGKQHYWRNNGDLQWFFLILLLSEFATLFAFVIGSGTNFYEAVVQ
ncbi:MAG: hypothetical protein KDK34_05490, partial [Leptospiraceae bacterium]|nr:hypothetical protein [Leptospiraceae bacterium]